jgi:hypothetical protein
VPGYGTPLKLPASSNTSLQELLQSSNSPAVTPKHAAAAGSLAKNNKFSQQTELEPQEVDVLAPRTPPLSPKLPAVALNAAKVAGATANAEAAAAAVAAPELEVYRQVFEGKQVLIIVSEKPICPVHRHQRLSLLQEPLCTQLRAAGFLHFYVCMRLCQPDIVGRASDRQTKGCWCNNSRWQCKNQAVVAFALLLHAMSMMLTTCLYSSTPCALTW